MTIASELGPVLCAIMVGARAGSGITAEIGTMKVTEQLDALVTLSEDPVHYLVLPRVIAGLVMVPVLTIFTDMVAILGGSFVAIWELGINQQQYIEVSLNS
jgi:phospholipid/cholesterol/gamma-HCH transport system permease protein